MGNDKLLAYVLLDIALVIVLARLFAVVLTRIGQPPVLAEIIAGIALGPTLFGAVSPDAAATLFSPEVTQMLSAIGGVGLVLFMFFIGLELDYSMARRHQRTVSWVSLGSLLTPLACGVLLALVLYPTHGTVAGQHVPKAGFVLFICVAIAITAFPVLARILVDHDLDSTELGVIAMSSAAFQDLAAWLLLALALAASTGEALTSALWKVGAVLALVVVLVAIAKPAMRSVMRHASDLDGGETIQLAIPLVLLTASAGFTQLIGLHAVIGAFLFGVSFPRDCRPTVIPSLLRALWPITMSLLLPIYFLGPGLNFDLASVGIGQVGALALIIGVACGAKLLGTAASARAAGLTWRDSGVLGVLLNTRGLVELIILSIGFTEGVLDQTLYSQFVVMALVATLLTSPILRLAIRGGRSPLTRSASHPALWEGAG